MGLFSTNRVLSNPKDNLSYDEILSKIDEYLIYAKYIGNFKIGGVYKSPLREDKSPSFGIFVGKKSGKLLYKDMSTGDCGDVIKFVRSLKGLNSHKEALDDILSGLSINIQSNDYNSKKRYTQQSVTIRISRKRFSKSDLDFWSSFFISETTLAYYNVNVISKYTVNGILKDTYKKDNPIFSYKVFDKFKIYKPLGLKSEKWRGNLSSLDLQGFEQLPESGDLLIITKSLKDVMLLYEMGYLAVAPASESIILPEIVMSNLKSRFKKIVVFYDRDKTGVNFTRRMIHKYGIDFMFINKSYKKKDISDFSKKFGFERGEALMISQLRKILCE